MSATSPTPNASKLVEPDFKYFAEIEECFQRARGTPTLLSPLDWALIESWKDAGVPLEAVETRRDETPFDPQQVKLYLASNLKAVDEARQAAKARNQRVLSGELAEIAEALRAVEAGIDPQSVLDFQDIETRLTALEEKLTATLTRAAPTELLTEFQREVDRGLARARRTMTVPQIESLSRQFLKRRLFEHYRVPRLSLFFM
ncbi:MAG: hypothetical protein DMG22_01635 [Acidobacteria bacterium]|nr:MAG: hypothetical protein DMG22_01635 [Acidobacteriota bacterium]